jgi:predicted RNA-binding Zn-ribbon protein involved in translation (DUF1610 family)
MNDHDEHQPYNPCPGETIETTAYNACLLADSLGKPVGFTFNKTAMVVVPGSQDDQVVLEYEEARAQNRVLRMLVSACAHAQPGEKLLLAGHAKSSAGHPCPRCKSDKLDKYRPTLPLRVLSGLYYCPDCGYRNSTTNHLGQLMFPVQSLPDGALPIYDRAPDVAELVTGDEEEETDE